MRRRDFLNISAVSVAGVLLPSITLIKTDPKVWTFPDELEWVYSPPGKTATDPFAEIGGIGYKFRTPDGKKYGNYVLLTEWSEANVNKARVFLYENYLHVRAML